MFPQNFTNDTVMFTSVSPTGHVFSLKLILFGTKEDPLANNSHVDRRTKKVERVNIQQRKRGA